ncbi:DUF6527 family protein [Paracoccus sp. SY]|uniref:DUF6527 family protein n=1 Tax=Paracoccus sp. SY TaxID=1330255 RepID=UPI000CD03D3F
MRAIRQPDITALRTEKIAGSFVHHGSGIAFICPCGCARESYLPKDEGDRIGPAWTFSGTEDAPTVRPSVFNSGMPCQWHGWLTDGDWQSC